MTTTPTQGEGQTVPTPEPTQSDDPVRSPKTILSLSIGYEDLMLFYTDGTSESIALSEKCQKEQQEKTDAFADAIRNTPKATDTNVASPKVTDECPICKKPFIAGVAHRHSPTAPDVQGDDINQMLMSFEGHIYSELGHKYPVTNQKQLTRFEVKNAIQSQLDAAYQRGRIDEAKTCEEVKRHG